MVMKASAAPRAACPPSATAHVAHVRAGNGHSFATVVDRRAMTPACRGRPALRRRGGGMRGRAVWMAVVVTAAACARQPEKPVFTGEPFLLVWAGDADRKNADFLAVLD